MRKKMNRELELRAGGEREVSVVLGLQNRVKRSSWEIYTRVGMVNAVGTDNHTSNFSGWPDDVMMSYAIPDR